MTHVREIPDEADMTVIGESARAEGVVGEVVAREGSVEGASEVESGDAPSEARSYVVTAVPTRPRSSRASKQVVRVSGAMAMDLKRML
jgi:hypothetical protein